MSSCFHSESNICLFESWSVVCSVTCYCNNVSKLLQARNHDVLVVWSRSSQHFQLISHQLHVLKISDSFSFNVFTHLKDSFFGFFIYQGPNKLIEIRAFHADAPLLIVVIRKEDSALSSNGHSCDQVIASDHSDSDASLVALSDGVWYFFSDDVFDASDGYQSQSALLYFVNFASFLLLLV